MRTATESPVLDLGLAPELPRTHAALARATNALYATADMQHAPVRGRPWQFRWRWPAGLASRAELAGRSAHRFAIGPHGGWLVLDEPLVALMLEEPRAHLLPADLRLVLLADALQDVTRGLENLLHLRFEWRAETSGPVLAAGGGMGLESAACFELACDGIQHGGRLHFDDKLALGKLLDVAPRPRPPPVWTHVDALRLPLRFSVGFTEIRLKEIEAVRAGDIVRVDRWQAVGSAIQVVAHLGHRAGWRLQGLAEESRIALTDLQEMNMQRDVDESVPGNRAVEPGGLPLERLDALEMVLRFEVGDLSLPLGELRSLRPGHVFDLGQPLNRCPVRIVAHGNVLGSGYLVAVGDQLGVRVGEFTPGAL